MKEIISLFGSKAGAEELSEVEDCINRQWLGSGPKTKEFEKRIAEKCNIPDSVFVNNGSNALQVALRVLDLPKGSEVILPSFTWVACANAIVLEGLIPVFCDVDLNTMNLRVEDIEQKLTEKTSAIMVVHYAGKPADMDGISRFNLPIIEDAAHAIDSYYKGKHCGTIGTVGIFSFDAVKNLTTGEGGALISKDPELLERAKRLRYCGIGKSGFQASSNTNKWWEYDITEFFPKMLNSDVAAAIGLAQLGKLGEFQKRRKELWELYTSTFKNESWANSWTTTPIEEENDEKHSYFTYCLRVKNGLRDKLANYLYSEGIYTSLRFHPLHLNPIYKTVSATSGISLPNCEILNDTALNIPFHHRLTDNHVDRIFSTMEAFSIKNTLSETKK